jgi:4-carboxymuconolactone decarboxylase
MGDRSAAVATYEAVLCRPFDVGGTPLEQVGLLDFVYGEVWNRPGLTRRERRLATMTLVGAADAPDPIRENVYGALRSGDLLVDELYEVVLHFAVYAGWPKASLLNQVVAEQWARVCEEDGVAPDPPADPIWRPELDVAERMRRGVECFERINCVPAPPPDSPYTGAGILPFVFGEIWQRPGLSVRDRRFVTIPAVGVANTETPIASHVFSALKSGDLSLDEVLELVLHVAAYAGWPKASRLNAAAQAAWAAIEASDDGDRTGGAPHDRPR